MKTLRGFIVGAALVLGAVLLVIFPTTAQPPGSGGPPAVLSALSTIPPTWSQILPADDGEVDGCNSSRFACVMPDATFPNGAAVRDNETGIVWERLAGDTNGDSAVDPSDRQKWDVAIETCVNKTVGGRNGWRAPSLHELTSLRDPAAMTPILLPTDHPFLGVQLFYWSASTTAIKTGPGDFREIAAWEVRFDNSTVQPFQVGLTSFVWCVRGGGPIGIYGRPTTAPATGD